MGFYNLDHLTKQQLYHFFKDAVLLSYDSHVEVIDDVDLVVRRKRSNKKTLGEMLDNCSPTYHNVCIDRSVQYESSKYGEIGYCTLGSPDYFLYIFVTLENLQKLVEKYQLKERD